MPVDGEGLTVPVRQMRVKVAIVVFPGTNCERDTLIALRDLDADARLCWHTDTAATNAFLRDADAFVIPGGFAHGDYLRPGAIARSSPAIDHVRAAAARGAPVLGICNGFQILTEAGLLPGALGRNRGLTFICESTELEVASARSVVCANLRKGERVCLPINHFDGSYVCDEATLSELVANDQIVFKYRNNPNGSVGDIAGISNRDGNVVGLMPHPERATADLLGGSDGVKLFDGLLLSAAVPAAC